MMKYKGYIGVAQYDDEAEIFHGEIVNTRDVITFQSDNAKLLKKEMADSVDFYLEHCEKVGKKPSKPFPGEFLIRTTPEHHGLYTAAAKMAGLSLNKWADQTLEAAAKTVMQG